MVFYCSLVKNIDIFSVIYIIQKSFFDASEVTNEKGIVASYVVKIMSVRVFV